MGRRRSGFIFIVFGLLLALAAGGFTFVQAQKVTAPPVEMVKVVVALQEVPERTIIPTATLALREVPKESKPATALTDINAAAGKMALTRIQAEEMILSTKVADTTGRSGLSFTLEPEKVVITFPSSDIVQTGALQPGDLIDLLITVDLSQVEGTAPTTAPGAQPAPGAAAAQKLATQLTMQNLRILAIGPVATGQQPQKGGAAPTRLTDVLTFAVSHQEALILKHIKDDPTIKVDFVLKPAGDTKTYTTQALTLKGLVEQFNIKPPP